MGQGISFDDTPMNLEQQGSTLTIHATVPKNIRQIEIRLQSNRNDKISRYTSISPYDPDSVKRKKHYSHTDKDTWYPVVDVRIEKGMEGVCIFKGSPTGYYTFGGPYFTDSSKIDKKIVFPDNRLEYWENSLQVNSKKIVIKQFYLRKTYPVIIQQQFMHTFHLLSNNWSGTVSIYAHTSHGLELMSSQYTEPQKSAWHNTTLEALKGGGITKSRLLSALEGLIKDGLKRQNNNPSSPTYGSFNTFYDLHAKVYRSSYWLWGGSPIVKMAINALKVPEIKMRMDSAAIMQAMNKVGQLYLKYQVRQPGHPSRGSYLTIWHRDPGSYPQEWLGTSDSGIMVNWVMIPLYKATGNEDYLRSAEFWCKEEGKVQQKYDILPHYYMDNKAKFSDRILNETGWDPSGHAALYAVTGNDNCRKSAKIFMDEHMAKFQRKNGMWNRKWMRQQKRSAPPAYHTRGSGWVMVGYLAMNRMYPNTKYLKFAKKMADLVMHYQNPDGSWYSRFKGAKGSKVAPKATSLWSLLFYRLYLVTGKDKYLQSARKSLLWCLENQYTGPDPEAIGGLVGRTKQSMVGYRSYYPSTTAYTTGFFGLAILQELKLLNKQE